jgi:hypothetical protein
MGWTEKVCNKSKLLEVLYTTVDEEDTIKDDGKRYVTKRSLVNISRDKRKFSLPEFRTGVSMLLPRINCSSNIPIKEQIKPDSLSIKTIESLTSYMDKSMVEAVDLLNDAYLLRVSISNPKSKTKPVHYQARRNALLYKSAHLKYRDARGITYKGLFDLPDRILKQFCEILPYAINSKRPAEAAPQAGPSSHEEMNVDEDTSIPQGNPPKKVKVSKGQSAKARRQSGQLARKNAVRSSQRNAAGQRPATRSITAGQGAILGRVGLAPPRSPVPPPSDQVACAGCGTLLPEGPQFTEGSVCWNCERL